MAALLDIPRIKNTKAFHLKRWAEVYDDPELHRYPGRVETNCFGHAVLFPVMEITHSMHQSAVGFELMKRMSQGRVLMVCPVLTSDGIKAVDAAWITGDRVKVGLKDEVLTIAPEVCVEAISPRNAQQEMEARRDLYFEAGAEEVWFCDKQGGMHFFLKADPSAEVKTSVLCPSMPKRIEA